ncbi:MAG: decaprenyl-phosphate phosphoribosyltransferase [Deltaproteobacteria bacterium]|nr:decaprenyl-phosphate phosphoribosyltransferase [Deltaproteobacteria bacterium]
MVLALVKAARPHQWIKNAFVAAPLVFALRIYDVTSLLRASAAVLCFCILSSAVYLLNDLADVERDRAHPTKRNRPIASGALSVTAARAALASFSVAALLGCLLLSFELAVVAAGYFVLNIAYTFGLKRVPFVDVGCISLGFLLRVLAGTYAIAVPASPWLLICTGLLSSLLGFGKRAHELRLAGEGKGKQRDVLERYHPGILRALMVMLALGTVGAYSLYTQSTHALSLFHTRGLALTVPCVVFGIVRFVWLTFNKPDAESPTDSMLRDRIFLANLLAYAAVVAVVLYWA